MLTLDPGNSRKGFSTLDALIAIILMTMAWISLVPQLRSGMDLRFQFEDELKTLIIEKAQREISSWHYVPDKD